MEVARKYGYKDPPAKKISIAEWHELYKQIPDEILEEYRYFRNDGDFTYMCTPAICPIGGARSMRKIKYDNALASLRMQNFMMYSAERHFRARQMGKKVFATIQDFGALAPIIMSSKNAIVFDACVNTMIPYSSESKELLNLAEKYGLNENYCVIRAMLPAVLRRAYTPTPDMCFAPMGAVCDDGSAIYQLLDWLGYKCTWFEIPVGKEPKDWYKRERFRKTYDGYAEYQEYALEFLTQQFRIVKEKVEEITGELISDEDLRSTIKRINRGRELVAKIRDLVYEAKKSPLPASETMAVDFASMNFSNDYDECMRVLEHVYETVRERVERNEGILPEEAPRVLWTFPPLDARIFDLMEDMGIRIISGGYFNQHLRCKIREDGDPLEAMADNYLNAPPIASSEYKARVTIETIRKYEADGVVFTGIFGSSHCPVDSRIISQEVKEALSIPTLSLDCSFPGDEPWGQTRTRYETFVEILKSRR